MRIRIYVMCLRITVTLTYVTSTLDHVLTTSLPRSKNSRTWRGRGQNETISDFYYVLTTSPPRPYNVRTTSLLRPSRFHYVLNTRSPSSSRFYYVLATSSQRPSSSYHARTTFPARSNCKYRYINQSYILSSTPLAVGRNAHAEANKILSFYFSFCEIAQVQPVHQVRHDVIEGEQVARVHLCSCFRFRYDLNKSESNCLRVRDN